MSAMKMAPTSSAMARGTTENHGRLFLQLLVFDDASLGVHTVRERLEVDGCGGDLFLGCVVTVGQVPTTWQAEAHDARVRCQQSRVHGKVRWAPRVRLDVHAPSESQPHPKHDMPSKRDCARGVSEMRTEVLVHEERQFGHYRDVGRHSDQPCYRPRSDAGTRK